jgi:transcriptional regulator
MSTQENNDDRIALQQGTLDLLILKTLVMGSCHGQGIARLIQRQSEEVFFVDDGSLYLALQRLEEKAWICAKWNLSENNRKARFYSLTTKGREQLVEKQMDPDVPLIQPMLQRKQFEQTISQQMMFAGLAEFFGVLAVVLVATGLYGTLAYRVNTRTAEIGVRMAVGARQGQVVWMILKGSLLLTAAGALMGIPLAMLVGRALTSSLYGVKPFDAASYFLAVVGVLAVALVASAMPAARAARVDPLTALRAE